MGNKIIQVIGIIAIGFLGYMVGVDRGKQIGYSRGLVKGRVSQMIKEGYSLQDISRILMSEQTDSEIEHYF